LDDVHGVLVDKCKLLVGDVLQNVAQFKVEVVTALLVLTVLGQWDDLLDHHG
jgi:hypothetical protein